MSHKLYELDVRLHGIEPAIWRTIEVPGSSSLADVHYAIQVAMGWTNSHLHQFVIGSARYGMDTDEDRDLRDEREFLLEELVGSRAKFVYEYDFGDGWEHAITVKRVATQTKPPKPRCTAGARACPPEDCGGPGGYENLLAALRDPKHEQHESLVVWSENFKPERFAIPKHGLELQRSMTELEEMARGGDDEENPIALPQGLVEAVLALEPMQRASLVAVIAGSLADEVNQATAILDMARAMEAKRPVRKR